MTDINPPRRRPIAPPSGRLTIPMVRDELTGIADALDSDMPLVAQRIRYLVEQMKRRTATRRAPVRHEPLTETQKEAIRQYALTHPEMHQQDIAELFGTNSGRVSEALRGKRTEA